MESTTVLVGCDITAKEFGGDTARGPCLRKFPGFPRANGVADDFLMVGSDRQCAITQYTTGKAEQFIRAGIFDEVLQPPDCDGAPPSSGIYIRIGALVPDQGNA